MRGDEERIIQAFVGWLTDQGWQVQREVAFVDILATRGEQTLYAEAKGRTSSPGLDVDTMYGQLLRRIPPDEVGNARFAVVVPDVTLRFALRVPVRVRAVLGIDVYSVTEAGEVSLHGSTPLTDPDNVGGRVLSEEEGAE